MRTIALLTAGFFIDRSGRVVYKHTGPVNDELLREQVDRLVAHP